MRWMTPARQFAHLAADHGFDLSFRPHSYADYADPISAVLAGIEGEQRRRDARAVLLEGEATGDVTSTDGVGDARLPALPAADPVEIGPRYMGGESLPPHAPGEVTIARIAFRTLTWHVVEIRAIPVPDGYRYRIVHDGGVLGRATLQRSDDPLTLAELVNVIEQSYGLTGERGLVIPVLEAVFGERDEDEESASFRTTYVSTGDRSAKADAIRAFITVSSDFYADLEGLYRAKVDEWMLMNGFLRHAPPPGAYRTGEPVPEPVWGERQDTRELAIDRVMRAWWLDRGGPLDEATGIERGRQAIRVRQFLREHWETHGRLPTGMVKLHDGTSEWRVDFGDLTETGELIELVLRYGEPLGGEDVPWLADVARCVTVARLDDWNYVIHPDGFEGPIGEDRLESDFLREYLWEKGERLAVQEWDSGGPGAGAGEVFAFRALGAVWIVDDVQVLPYADLEEARNCGTLYWVNGATTRIWDSEHGLVFERGVLYKPDVVDRYGSVSVPVKLASEVVE